MGKASVIKSRIRRAAEQYAARFTHPVGSFHVDHSDSYFRRSGIPYTEFARRAALAAKHADPQFQDVNLPRAFVYGAFLKYRDIYDHRLTPNEFKHLLAEVHKGGHIDLSRAVATGRVDPAIIYDSQVNIGPRDSHREFHFVGHPRSHPVWVFRPATRETYAADPCGDTSGGFQEGNTCASGGKTKTPKKPKLISERAPITDKEIKSVLDEFNAHNRADKNKFATDLIRKRRKKAIEAQEKEKEKKPEEKPEPSNEPEPKAESSKEIEKSSKPDREAIRKNMDSVRKVAKEYGFEVIDGLGPAKGRNELEDRNTFATYHYGTNKIYINTDNPKWDNIKESIDNNYKKGWFSSNHDDFVIHHEIGHALHVKSIREHAARDKSFLSKLMTSVESLISGVDLKGFEEDTKFIKMFNSEFAKHESELIAKEVSQYAATKPNEFVAEYFAGVKGGKTYSKEVQALYDRFLGPPVR